jgi:hypothetical protein
VDPKRPEARDNFFILNFFFARFSTPRILTPGTAYHPSPLRPGMCGPYSRTVREIGALFKATTARKTVRHIPQYSVMCPTKVYLRTRAARCQMTAHMSISIIHSHSTTRRHYLPLLNARVMNVSVRCHTRVSEPHENISSTFSAHSNKHLILNRKASTQTHVQRCATEHDVTVVLNTE